MSCVRLRLGIARRPDCGDCGLVTGAVLCCFFLYSVLLIISLFFSLALYSERASLCASVGASIGLFPLRFIDMHIFIDV